MGLNAFGVSPAAAGSEQTCTGRVWVPHTFVAAVASSKCMQACAPHCVESEGPYIALHAYKGAVKGHSILLW